MGKEVSVKQHCQIFVLILFLKYSLICLNINIYFVYLYQLDDSGLRGNNISLLILTNVNKNT